VFFSFHVSRPNSLQATHVHLVKSSSSSKSILPPLHAFMASIGTTSLLFYILLSRLQTFYLWDIHRNHTHPDMLLY